MIDPNLRKPASDEEKRAIIARLFAAKAAGIGAKKLADASGVHQSRIHNVLAGGGISPVTVAKLNAALDALKAEPAPPASALPVLPPKIKGRSAWAAPKTSISKAEADRLRPLVAQAIKNAPGRLEGGRKGVLESLGLTSGSLRQFVIDGMGLRHATAERVWAGLGLPRPAEFAATATPIKDYVPESELWNAPKLAPEIVKDVKAFTNYAIDVLKVCDFATLCQGVTMARQGLASILNSPTRHLSARSALKILLYLEKRAQKKAPRVADDARALIRRIKAPAAGGEPFPVHASAPGVAPGRAMVLTTRDLLRDSLPRFGNLPALAKHVGLTAAKTGKILKGSTMSRGIAEQIAERLGAPPAQMTLALAPHAELATLAGPRLGADMSAAVETLVARWSAEARALFEQNPLAIVLALAKKP